jgi:glycosyltransferase involved in cell wall biosynthesis
MPEKQWVSEPTVLIDKTFEDVTPRFSIVMPIHNQENIVKRVLNSILQNTVGKYEIILIIDGCTDNTKINVISWIENIPITKGLVKILVFENITGIFETSCDNQGFIHSRGKYIVEIQADMEVLTYGFNVILATPLEMFDDLIAVGGRCCHGLNGLTSSINTGKIGGNTEYPHKIQFGQYNTVTLSHTTNRGPLVLSRTKLHEMGYLDEEHYVLGDDDHDLFTRAYNQNKWRVGFIPVEVFSPSEWGSTRKSASVDSRNYLSSREVKMKDGFLGKFRANFIYPVGEVRNMDILDQTAARTRLLT